MKKLFLFIVLSVLSGNIISRHYNSYVNNVIPVDVTRKCNNTIDIYVSVTKEMVGETCTSVRFFPDGETSSYLNIEKVHFYLYKDNVLFNDLMSSIGCTGFNTTFTINASDIGTFKVIAKYNYSKNCDALGCDYFIHNDYTREFKINPAGSGITYCAPSVPFNAFCTSQGYSSQDQYPRYLSDVNGDGKSDIVAIGASDVYVSLSNSTNSSTSFNSPTAWLTNNFASGNGWTDLNNYPRYMADVNGDGKKDLVGFGYSGVYVSLSNGSSFASPSLWVSNYGKSNGWNTNGDFYRVVEDVNGDGKADVVGFGGSDVYVSLSNGSSFSSPNVWLSNNFCSGSGWLNTDKNPRFLVDINNDGKKDIVGCGNTSVYVSISNGTSFGTSTIWSGNFCFDQGYLSQYVYPRFVKDIDGDNLPDLLGFGANGVYYSKNLGSSFGTPALSIEDEFTPTKHFQNNNAHPRFLAKVNADNLLDIVGFGECGLYISTNSGNGSFSFPQVITTSNMDVVNGWTTNGEFYRCASNVDDDPRDEIIGFGSSSVYIVNGTCNGGTAFRTTNSESLKVNDDEVFMSQNYPNPFIQSTSIDYKIDRLYSNAQILGTDVLGRELFNFKLSSPYGKVEISESQISSNKLIFISLIIDGIKYKTILGSTN